MKFLQNTQVKDVSLLKLVFGTAALIAVISATPVTLAHAQSIPAGLLRLDPPQASHDTLQLTDQQRAKVRNVYAHARKPHVN